MADNYIEKRMEELRSGASSQSQAQIRNLDSLVVKSAEKAAMDPEYKVHSLQLAAIMVTVKRADISDVEVSAADGAVIVSPSDASDAAAMINAGRVVQTVILKANEMGLCAAVESIEAATGTTKLLIGRKK